jgi:hypothetical protein
VLATTQCIRNHIRPHNYYAPNLRSWKPREFMGTGFDKTSHKVDVRRIPPAPAEDKLADGLGHYNVQNIGIFLWSLNAYTLTEVPATAVSVSSQCFRFSTLGADMPLFHQATELPEETTTLAGPSNVPDRLTRRLLCQDIRAITQEGASPVYYGDGLSLAIYSWALESNSEPKTNSSGELNYAGPGVFVEGSGLAVTVAQSILGPLYLNAESKASLTDTILDASGPTAVAIVASIDTATNAPVASGALTMNGCTVVGKVYASLLNLVSDCIFVAELTQADVSSTPPLWNAPLWSARHQQGCVRFSYVPGGAILPRQFQCVEQAPGTPVPMFYSLQYGNPAYAKLLPTTDRSIRQGADDGGEMGAYHSLLAPQREADLLIRLAEYIPVGLEYGIFYES